MKLIYAKLFGITLLLFAACAVLPAFAQTNTLPDPSTLPAIDPNGLSFTNVSLQFASGYEYQGAVGGASLAYVSGQYDAFHLKNIDLGFGGEVVLANSSDALEKASLQLDVIKNLDNFQLVGKVLAGREFAAPNTGWFVGLGGDVNYNLSRGLGGWLGSKSGFTYLQVGYAFEKNVSTFKNNSFEHLLHAGVGYSF